MEHVVQQVTRSIVERLRRRTYEEYKRYRCPMELSISKSIKHKKIYLGLEVWNAARHLETFLNFTKTGWIIRSRQAYPVRPGCCSSPASHLCTDVSVLSPGTRIPLERSLQLHPWTSSAAEMTNPNINGEVNLLDRQGKDGKGHCRKRYTHSAKTGVGCL